MTNRRDVVAALVAGATGLVALSQMKPAAAAVPEADAAAAINRFLGALFSGDAAKVDAVLAPSFQIMRSDGSSFDKTSYLNALPKTISLPVISNLKVTSDGDHFVASYVVTSDQTIDGQPVEAVSPRLSVYEKSGDEWLIVSHANFARIG